MVKRLPSHSVLLIDIASGSVGVGLAGIREGTLPELVYTTRAHFNNSTIDTVALEYGLRRSLRESLEKAFKHGVHRLASSGYPAALDHATLTFSSPWFVSQVEGRETPLSAEPGLDVFEQAEGLVSAASRAFLVRIEEEIIRHFGLKRGINFQSYPLVFSKVFTHAFENSDSAIFANLTARATDLLRLEEGKVAESITLPLGHAGTDESLGEDIGFRGYVYVSADADPLKAKQLLSRVLPKARIVSIGTDNGFTDLVVRTHPLAERSDRLSLLASFSNIFL